MLPHSYYNEDHLRKRQIDTLKVFNDNVVEVKDDEEYRVEFSADGKNMMLNVVLSPEFPNEKPSIFVNPVIPHPWLAENSNLVVGAPGLINYTQHSDLGRVVQAIIREFQKSLPTLVTSEEKCSETPQSHVSAQSIMFPDLNDLTIEELHGILENTDLQDKILETNPQLIELDLETEELMCSIEEIAQDNVAKQQLLDELKTEVIDSISTIVQMKMSCEGLHRRHAALAAAYEPRRVRDRLRAAAAAADEKAERLAEQFLLGNIPVETFVASFAEQRALGQARRAREERLAHQLAQLDRAAT